MTKAKQFHLLAFQLTMDTLK